MTRVISIGCVRKLGHLSGFLRHYLLSMFLWHLPCFYPIYVSYLTSMQILCHNCSAPLNKPPRVLTALSIGCSTEDTLHYVVTVVIKRTIPPRNLPLGCGTLRNAYRGSNRLLENTKFSRTLNFLTISFSATGSFFLSFFLFLLESRLFIG